MNNLNPIAILQGRAGLPWFFLLAGTVFGGLLFLYDVYVQNTPLLNYLIDVIATFSAQILSILGIETTLLEMGAEYHTEIHHESTAKVIVSKSAVAYVFFALLLAVVAAWPGDMIKKVVILILGFCLLFVINCIRVALLLMVDINLPLYFDMFRQYGSPLFMIFFTLLYFYLWTVISGEHPADFDQ